MLEDRGRPSLRLDDAIHAFDQPRVVRREEERDPQPIAKVIHQVEDRAAGGGVEVRRRLVGEDQRRTVHQRARDGDALALTAGQLARTAAVFVGEPDALQQLVDALAAFGLSEPRQQQGILDVLARRQHRHEVEALEDEAEAIAPDGGEPARPACATRAGRPAGFARVGTIEAADQVQQGGLPAAGRAGERDELAGTDGKRDIADGRHRGGAEPVTLGDAERSATGRSDIRPPPSRAGWPRQEESRGRKGRRISGPDERTASGDGWVRMASSRLPFVSEHAGTSGPGDC